MSKLFKIALAVLFLGVGLRFWQVTEAQNRRDAELDRQHKVGEQILDAIHRYANSPNILTQHDAEAAMDRAREENLSSERIDALWQYYLDAHACAIGLHIKCSYEVTNWVMASDSVSSPRL